MLDYGAKSDGATDDTAAIQSAINAAISSSGRRGGIVFFPTGTYRITSPLVISLANGVVLRGANSQTSVIRVDSPTPTTPVAAAVIIELSQHCGVESLKFDCIQILLDMVTRTTPPSGDNIQAVNAVTSTSGSMIVIRKYGFWCHVYDVRIDYGHNGIELDGSTETRLTKIQFRYMTGTSGVWLHGSPANPPEGAQGSYRAIVNDLIADNPYKHATRNNGMKTYAASTAFAEGDIIQGQGGKIYQVHTAGTTGTGGVAPYGLGDTVDGTVRWRFISGPISWILLDSYGYSLVIDKAACINGFNGFKMQDNITPGTGKYPIWAFIYDLECDHCYNASMDLQGGEGVFITTSWLGSVLNGNGVNVASTYRGEVCMTNCRIMGNHYHGIAVQPGPVDVKIEGCMVGQNSGAGYGLYDGIFVADGAKRIQLVNNRSGTLVGTAANTQAYGARVGNVSSAIISLNNFENNVSGGLLLGNASTNVVSWNNLNAPYSVNNDLRVVSAAANVTVTAQPPNAATDATDLVLAGYGNDGRVVTSRSRIGGLDITANGNDVYMTATPTYTLNATNTDEAAATRTLAISPVSNVSIGSIVRRRAMALGGSAYFDTSRSAFATVPGLSYAFPWNTAPSTLEAWVYFPTSTSGTTYIFGSYFPDQAVHGLSFGVSGTKAFFRYFSLNPNTDTTLYSPLGAVQPNAWTHLAATATGTSSSTGNISLYVNGVRQSLAYANGTSVGETPAKIADAGSFAFPFTIGMLNNAAYNSFYLDSARLLLGNAAYSGASFTPPTSLGAGPAGANTVVITVPQTPGTANVFMQLPLTGNDLTANLFNVPSVSTTGNTGLQYTGITYAGPLVEKRTNAVTRHGIGTYNINDTRVYSGTGSTASRVLLGYALSDTSFYDVLTVAREGTSTTTGNVGINTSAPAAPLHVVGNVRVQGSIISTLEATAPTLENGQLVATLNNNTSLVFSVRGTDGVLRTGTVALT